VLVTRHSPRPLWADEIKDNSGAMRRGKAKVCPDVIARSSATKQSRFVIAATRLDRFAPLAMTVLLFES